MFLIPQTSDVAFEFIGDSKEVGNAMARARRKKLSAPLVANSNQGPQVHDRRAGDIPSNVRAIPVEIDDPFGFQQGPVYRHVTRKDGSTVTRPDGGEDPKELSFDGQPKITVMRALRDDPLAAMEKAGQIDKAMYLAGRHWQKAHELSEIGGARGIDTTREAVDGGQIAQSSITDSQRRAFADLIKASRALGMEGEAIVRDILGRHMTVTLAAAKRGLHAERERLYIGRRFREALETLAVTFGYAIGKGGERWGAADGR
jgi:hypothetical protein